MTGEEFRKHKRAKALERFERDRETHEEACGKGDVGSMESGEFIDLCESGAKRKLYDKWRNDYLREAEREFAEDAPPESAGGTCRMISRGRWSQSGSRLTVEEASLSAAAVCGIAGGGERRQSSGRFYFSAGDLYFVQPANSASREFCGSSDWISIFFRK